MYCRNCGKEIKDGSRFCLYCGQAVQGGNPGAQGTVPPPPAAKKKNEILRKWWFWAAVIIFAGAVIVFAINDISAEETVEKLQKFTYIDATDERCTFSYEDSWNLIYTTENEFVEFYEPEVTDCFTGCFGTYDFGNDGTFTYDLDENEIRIYFDYETVDGNLSILNYNIDDEELTLRIDGDIYEPAEEFEDYIDEYGLINVLEGRIDQFENNLEANGLSLDDVRDVSYDYIKEYV